MFKTILCTVFAGALSVLAFAGSASAAETTFNNPMQGGQRLDWCFNWGVGCGDQAANAYCVSKGYVNATNFGIAHDIGASNPTRLMGTGAVCDQGFCDGFTHITCFKPTPTTATFNSPMQGTERLDWCFNWGTGCGNHAANAYCQAKGFASAQSFAIAHDIGADQATRLIGTGAICDQGFCDGFAQITCQN